jgi:neopullulanase
MKKVFIFLIITLLNVFAQEIVINKIEPANWWTGMKMNKIQLMVYGKNLSNFSVSVNSKKISIDSIHALANKDYSFIDITIHPDAVEGNYKLLFKQKNKTASVDFPLFKKDSSKNIHQGFGVDDVVYLIMPDRFSDGDPTNNEIPEMLNEYLPDNYLGRHGGDLQGIINHLNYFTDLGVTALWLTPVLENNKSISYHGYAATDLYLIDRRLGTKEKYKELVDKAHAAGIKIIYDHVSNHIGANHQWIINPPVHDWFNGTQKNHLRAWHDKMIDFDIYGVPITKKYVKEGWFVDDMPDLNQRNKFVKNYLIQNSIWWIEFSGIDGIREDTYPYSDQKFLSDWAKIILNVYPHINIVGEVWTGVTPFLASYQKDSKLNKNINTNLPVVTDFAIRDAYTEFLEGRSNLHRIYEIVAQDYLYDNPNNILTFADNHDLMRMMMTAKENTAKVKLVLTHLLTSRGIPQIFYGTEIGIVGGNDDGQKRANFPGGFKEDKSNAFTKEGRSAKENDLYDFTKSLIELRKKYPALAKGELKHLPPIDNVYIYYKKLGNETILVVLNGDEKKREIDMNLLEDFCGKNLKLYDLMNNNSVEVINGKLILQPLSENVFSVK